MIYEALVKPMLFRMEPEEAHDFVLRNLQRIQRQPGLLYLIEKLYGVREEPGLASELLGIRFPSPIGLAAGLDKDARAVPALSSMGFGFMEVGSVTPIGQAGNDRPRLFRLPDDEALINRMGFNNGGIHAMKERLESCNALKIPLGINIGKNKRTPNEKAHEDYTRCLRSLYPYADFFIINLSSPNTPSLRKLQYGSELDELLIRIVAETERLNARHRGDKPVFVKIAPDMDGGELENMIGKIMRHGIPGVIAANTTVTRGGLTHPHREETGGLSGKPLHLKSTEIIRSIYKQSGGTLKIIGSGGIFTARDVYDKIRAGASLVEIYTSFIYKGPRINRQCSSELLDLLKQDGFASLSEAIGADHAAGSGA
ncbi:quinone-dependent dihydroorotate dehydrogenase [Paenibacillus chitinolyticus]|uniref:quinone-dependent dihydroorotate dehydrogenase n=1 Tax=Paenibacillus chitinolyticus TaxID=79263 RepID=UPI003557AD33